MTSNGLLKAYAGITTAALTAFLLAAAAPPDRQSFSEIDVERINLREPDGTLRMTIHSSARSPGIIVRGTEYAHPGGRDQAGMLFFNDEGTETGGLIFGGERLADGTRTSGGSLTFDRYEQDQVVQLTAVEEGDERYSGVFVNDQPEQPLDFAALDAMLRTEDPAQLAQLQQQSNAGATMRAFLGRWTDGSSQLQLRDDSGAKRLVIRVDDAGDPIIEFLDAQGSVTRTIAGTAG